MRQKQGVFSLFLLSLSSRRAWIEIYPLGMIFAGAVVALLAEGVDRNGLTLYNTEAVKRSPSSRRAWIEIDRGSKPSG